MLMYFQQKWLLQLQNFSPNPIWVVKNKAKNDSTPGSWIKLLQYPFFRDGLIDYRTVLPNEICIEQDFKKWVNQRFWGQRIENTLNQMKVPHLMCHSGGKGLHWHIFFKARGIEGVTGYRQLRFKLYHYFLNWADVPDSYRGLERPYDITSYTFSDKSQGHLIREIGGMKRQRKRIISEIPRENNIISGDVVFPKKVPVWTIPYDILRDLDLGSAYPLRNCLQCEITIPSDCYVLGDNDSVVAPQWIGCHVCKKTL